jgi:hypothetical protein
MKRWPGDDDKSTLNELEIMRLVSGNALLICTYK